MNDLSGKRILLGITGGIAAYKACDLLRRLQDLGAEIRVAMTPGSEHFIGHLTLAALSGHPVYRTGDSPSAFAHIDFPRWADLMVVAPCSAQSLARLAHGFADEPVSLCFCAAQCPKFIAPAMNTVMYQSPPVQENLRRLQGWGVRVISAPVGQLACGEVGAGRFPETADLVQEIQAILSPPDPLHRVLITAGRTEEPIDPVRYISNRSSGITAIALAAAFYRAGFAVDFVHGPMDVSPPAFARSVFTRSAREMHAAVMELQPQSRAIVLCAAVADFRPKAPAVEKIKASHSLLSLDLEANPNILSDAHKSRLPGQILVGFALETRDATAHAREKWERSGADFMVVNTPVRIESGFGKDQVEYALMVPGVPSPELALGTKESLAQNVVERVRALLGDAL